MRRLAPSALALLVATSSSLADTFVLRDGSSLEGQVLRTFPDEEGRADRWEVRTLRGRRTLLAAEVREVRARRPADPPYPWVQFEAKFSLVDPGDADGNYLLGSWARDQGMEAEALRAFRRAVAADPEHVRARTALGHLRVDGRWTVPPGRAGASEERGEPVAGEAPPRWRGSSGAPSPAAARRASGSNPPGSTRRDSAAPSTRWRRSGTRRWPSWARHRPGGRGPPPTSSSGTARST